MYAVKKEAANTVRERGKMSRRAHLTLSTPRIWDRVALSASVYNLFDEKYGDPGSTEHRQDTIEQDGRTFRVKVTASF